jgi:hypothetical protein
MVLEPITSAPLTFEPLPYTEKSSPAANQRRDQPRRPSARVLFPAPASQTQRYVLPPWRRDGNRIPSVRSPLPLVPSRHARPTPNPDCRCHQPPWPVSALLNTPRSAKFQREKSGKSEMCPLNTLSWSNLQREKAKPSSKKKRPTSRKSHPLPALSSDTSRTVTQ